LFFNGHVESGKALDFDRDFFFDPADKRRRKKQIRIEVQFSLPPNFKYPKSVAATKGKLGENFSIARTWERDRQGRIVDRIEVPTSPGLDTQYAWHFLNLITYRYIPNRTVPTLVLKDESRALAKSIQIRLKGNTSADDLIDGLQKASESLLKDASKSFQAAGAPIAEPQVAAPADLGELLTISGFQARASLGNSVRDEDWGSGHQAFFLYQLLYALDTHYSRFFGWKQATVWGVEEPESGLHRDLETQLAGEMRRWADDYRSKMQIVGTTHSPVFAMAAATGYWTEITNGATGLKAEKVPELVRAAERRGVSGWTQPVLAFPTAPVVLVEGKIDAAVLEHVATLHGSLSVRFMPLPELDPAEKGAGKDAITSYLKRHGGLIPNRPPGCPLSVVLDWDVSDVELKAARDAYGEGGGARVIRMDASYCDPRVGKTFAGIERFYPVDVIEGAIKAGELVAATPVGKPISVAKDELLQAKWALAERVRKLTLSAQAPALVRVWHDIQAAIKAP
jgi:hypothetical protein